MKSKKVRTKRQKKSDKNNRGKIMGVINPKNTTLNEERQGRSTKI